MASIDTRWTRKAHRWIAILFSLSVLMSAGSGVLHQVMSRTQAPPPKARPASKINPAEIKVSIAEASQRLGIKSEDACDLISVRSIGSRPWYQFMIHGQERPGYVEAITGEIKLDADERYAEQIASDFMAGKPVKKTAFLTHYDKEYINIFRILPVYRFDVEDGLGTRLYVSTMTGSVTRHTNNHKQWEASIFSNFHKLMFIPNKDIRDAVLMILTGGAFVAAALGIILFIATKRS